MRFRLASWLHLMATRIYDDFHTWELTTSSGEKIRFSCYYQYTASWPESVTDDCSCENSTL